MFTLKLTDISNNKFDYNNCVLSTSSSRPSKSLIDCNLYKKFTSIDFNIEIFNEFSHINYQQKKIEYFLLNIKTYLLLKNLEIVFDISFIKVEPLGLASMKI